MALLQGSAGCAALTAWVVVVVLVPSGPAVRSGVAPHAAPARDRDLISLVGEEWMGMGVGVAARTALHRWLVAWHRAPG